MRRVVLNTRNVGRGNPIRKKALRRRKLLYRVVPTTRLSSSRELESQTLPRHASTRPALEFVVTSIHLRAIAHAVPWNLPGCSQAIDVLRSEPDGFTHCPCIDKVSLAILDQVAHFSLRHAHLRLMSPTQQNAKRQ